MASAIIAFAGIFLMQCTADKEMLQEDKTSLENIAVEMGMNPSPEEWGELPPATVPLRMDGFLPHLKSSSVNSYLTPEYLHATLAAEQSIGETKTAYIGGAPAKGDLMFCFDLTGSMGGELNNAKVNSMNIMNAVRGVIPDTYFGLMSHMDYPGFYSGCGYSANYGLSTDYPYSLDQSLTSESNDVAIAIQSLVLGNGLDLPENYSRPFYESYSDMSIGWRMGTRKILLAWLDDVPHDCAFRAILGLGGTTGPDPGRDGVVGTDDDLEILEVLNGMKDNNITLIVLFSGNPALFPLWQAYTGVTGGVAVQINPDGTIPGGIGLDIFIADLILSQVQSISQVTLEVCTPGFEEWLTSSDPVSYTDIMLDHPWTADFDIEITVPAGTPDGVYEFDICLIGDGAEYGRQHVTITVQNAIEVPFDIRPTSCPNPVNRVARGVLPTAILGFEGFDVADIDPATVNISGVYPHRWSIEDVATPYYPFTDKELDPYSCNTSMVDGFMDLVLFFDNEQISQLLTGYPVNSVVRLEVSGFLHDGTKIIGEDIVVIVR